MKKLIGLLLILLVTAGCQPARNAVLPFKGTILVLHPAGEVEPSDDRLQETVQVLERRLDGLGVASAHVQPWGVGQILVWLPGVRLSQAQMSGLIGLGLLEFVDFSALTGPSEPGTCVLTTEQARLAGLNMPVPSCSGELVLAQPDGTPLPTLMTGTGLMDAQAGANTRGTPFIQFLLQKNSVEADQLVTFVAQHANFAVGIVIDGRLISAPIIDASLAATAQAGEMDGGIIAGNFTLDEADQLAIQIRYGMLPVQLNIVRSFTYGLK